MAKILTKLELHRLSSDFQLLQKHTQPSRSWLQHFFDLWYIMLGFDSNTLANIADIDGNLRTLFDNGGTQQTCNLLMASQAGGCGSFFPVPSASAGFVTWPNAGSTRYILYTGDHWGIVVGSNNVAVTPQDNALGAKIVQGAAAGQLLHGGTEILPPTFADPNGLMVLRRYFTNSSGGNVTIEEVGMYSPGFFENDNSYLFSICRDVVAPAVVVADTELLVATYTVQITV